MQGSRRSLARYGTWIAGPICLWGSACDGPGALEHTPSEALRACADAPSELHTIGDVITQLNSMPAPVSAACLVATVPRPLALVATEGTNSAQPASSHQSPRIFLRMDGLVMGVVPDGDGGKLLEFGEWVTPTRTLKGELEAPVLGPLADDAAYQHALYSASSTACGLCHLGEAPHPTIPSAFVSDAFRPLPDSIVTLDELRAMHDACVVERDSGARCEMFHALFDLGDVVDGPFDDEVSTFTR